MGPFIHSRILISATLCVCMQVWPVAAQDSAKPLLIKPGAPGGEPSQRITPEQSLALGQSYYTQDDVSFMQNMIIHHTQAIDMSNLIKARSAHQSLHLLGKRISLSQTGEIDMMRTWLSRRKQALEPTGDHSHHMQISEGNQPSDMPVMAGMLSPAQMVELAAAEGPEFEKLYLTGMIHHHKGALGMVNTLLSNPAAGEDPEISEFLSAIVADQSGEILRMQAMLGEIQTK